MAARREIKVTKANGTSRYAPFANLSGLMKRNRYASDKQKFTIEEVRIDDDGKETVLKVHAQNRATELSRELTEKDAQIAELQRQLEKARNAKPDAAPSLSSSEQDKMVVRIKELLSADTAWKQITTTINKEFDGSYKTKELQKLL